MNANVKGMLDYYRHPSMRRKLDGIIQTENGYHLTANEAWAFLCWCDDNGYRDIGSAQHGNPQLWVYVKNADFEVIGNIHDNS